VAPHAGREHPPSGAHVSITIWHRPFTESYHSSCEKKRRAVGLAASLAALSIKRSVYFAVALIFNLIALCCVGSSLVIEIESFVFPFLVGEYVIVTL
jgi:hypothetical protein